MIRRATILILLIIAVVESAILWRRSQRNLEISNRGHDGSGVADRTTAPSTDEPRSGQFGRKPSEGDPNGAGSEPESREPGAVDGVAANVERAPTDPVEYFEAVERLRTMTSAVDRGRLARTLAYRLNSARIFNFRSALPPKTTALERLQDPISEVRLIWSAIAVLYEDPDIDQAVAKVASSDPDPFARAMALDILGQRPMTQARTDTLVAAASDGHIECRISAVRSLRVVDDPRSLSPVAEAARAKDLRLRRVAWETLSMRAARDSQSLNELRRLIREKRELYETRILWSSISLAGAEKLLSREDLAVIESDLHR